MVLDGVPEVVGPDQVARRLRRPIGIPQILEARPVGNFHQRGGVQRGVDLVNFLRAPGAATRISHVLMRRSGRADRSNRTAGRRRRSEHHPLDRVQHVVGLRRG